MSNKRDMEPSLDYFELRRRHEEYKNSQNQPQPQPEDAAEAEVPVQAKPRKAAEPAPEAAVPEDVADAPADAADAPLPLEDSLPEDEPYADEAYGDEAFDGDEAPDADNPNPFDSFIHAFKGIRGRLAGRFGRRGEAEDEDYDDEDYDDYDDEPRSGKGLVIGLVILAVILAAIAGLLFVRLRKANAEVKDLTEQLNSTRTELNTLLTEKTTQPAAPEVTPEPTPEPDMVDATNGPEVVVPDEPQPAEPDMLDATPEPEPTPEPTPAGTPDSQYIGINTSTTINITTNPEAKTVKAGQSATFTAAAANWKWCAWRFISPDGLHEIIFDKVAGRFAGVTTAGGNTTTFTVNNIPKEMDGWKAVCLFVDAGNGMKVTEGGIITVTE